MTGEVRSLNVKLSCKYPFLIKFIELLSLTFTDFLSLFKDKSIKERSPVSLTTVEALVLHRCYNRNLLTLQVSHQQPIQQQ
jgi:hypothetical protein